ncbi:YhcB family protein [Salinispirillum marinum]|uniref:Z-ring associated protein G n=2 Tax=Saccharospirillaceae TaxID=255527 RepID=A0ABV8B8S0_9GAMM
MFDLATLFMGFTLGAAVGIVVTLLMSRKHGNADSVRKQLEALKNEHTKYQMDVTEHFARTSELIASLNQNYRNIEQHLQNGADNLVSYDYKLAQLRQGSDVSIDNEMPYVGVSKDYAEEQQEPESVEQSDSAQIR